jgi:hypothetical protein
MKNYGITEEQIKQLAKGNAKVKEWFPEVFETKLEIGKWYKDLDNGKFLFCFQGGYGNSDTHGLNYGFNSQNKFRETLGVHKRDVYTPATDSEVLEALTNEAIKRRFKEGVCINDLYCGGTVFISGNKYDYEEVPYTPYAGEMALRDSDGNILFVNGQWAEIIKTYTKEEAEKLLDAKII